LRLALRPQRFELDCWRLTFEPRRFVIEQRCAVTKTRDRSDAFCRNAVEVLNNNPNVQHGTVDLAELRRDLAALDLSPSRLTHWTVSKS